MRLLYKPDKQLRELADKFDSLYRNVQGKAQMGTDVWEKATEIYLDLKRKGMLIGDMDILIAAYCFCGGYTLVTRNTNDFERIDNLKYVNWF
jgi:tRNA(fMet)-specific endonuclease VapC